MTENKRFKWEDVYRWEVPAFLEVMNGLDAKNKQLKEENDELKQELESFEQVSFTDMCDRSRTTLYMKKENVGDV